MSANNPNWFCKNCGSEGYRADWPTSPSKHLRDKEMYLVKECPKCMEPDVSGCGNPNCDGSCGFAPGIAGGHPEVQNLEPES